MPKPKPKPTPKVEKPTIKQSDLDKAIDEATYPLTV